MLGENGKICFINNLKQMFQVLFNWVYERRKQHFCYLFSIFRNLIGYKIIKQKWWFFLFWKTFLLCCILNLCVNIQVKLSLVDGLRACFIHFVYYIFYQNITSHGQCLFNECRPDFLQQYFCTPNATQIILQNVFIIL